MGSTGCDFENHWAGTLPFYADTHDIVVSNHKDRVVDPLVCRRPVFVAGLSRSAVVPNITHLSVDSRYRDSRDNLIKPSHNLDFSAITFLCSPATDAMDIIIYYVFYLCRTVR